MRRVGRGKASPTLKKGRRGLMVKEFLKKGEIKMEKTICLECGKEFRQERDLQICDNYINLFDTDKLWQDHDNNKIDALDFNESVKIRERYRI